MNQYWKAKHEQAVKAYVNEVDDAKRSLIYNEFRTPLRRMISIILKRYYAQYINRIEVQVSECEAFIVENVIDKFKTDSDFKAYSFLGTSAKRRFHDVFIENTYFTKVSTITALNLEDEIGFLEKKMEPEGEGLYLDKLREMAVNHLKGIVNGVSEDDIDFPVLSLLLELLKEEDLSKFYVSYKLLKGTGYSYYQLRRALTRYGISRFVLTDLYTLQQYEEIIEASSTGDDIRIVLKNLRTVDEEKFKIADRANQKRTRTKKQNA